MFNRLGSIRTLLLGLLVIAVVGVGIIFVTPLMVGRDVTSTKDGGGGGSSLEDELFEAMLRERGWGTLDAVGGRVTITVSGCSVTLIWDNTTKAYRVNSVESPGEPSSATLVANLPRGPRTDIGTPNIQKEVLQDALGTHREFLPC